MYIVDEQFRIVNINAALREIYPDVKVGDHCYEALALGTCQCEVCPLKSDNVLFYNPIRHEWISANASDMEYPGHGRCYNIQFQLRQRISEAGTESLQIEDMDEHILELSGGKTDVCAIGGYHRCADAPGWPFLYFGESFETITGWTREEIERDFGNLFINMVLEEDVPLCAGLVENMASTGYSNAIYRLKKKGGGYTWVSDSTMRVTIGEETFFQGVLSDISKHIHALQLAKTDAEHLLYAVRATYEMIVSVNLTQNRYRLFNNNSFQTQGDEMSGVFDEVIAIHRDKVVEEHRELYYNTFSREALLRAHAEGKKSVHLEYQQCDENGVPHWLSTHTMFIDNSDGADVTEITISRNIDERKQREEEQMRMLSDALSLAENASRAKSEFLSRMSHDIRTPMNAVIGYATIAASHLDERERVKDSLKKILSSGEHLQGLINDVLDMSRIEAGKESLNEIRTSISEMVRTVLPMVQSQVATKQLELYIDTIDMTHEFVYADAQKIRQLLLNILGNAVKFTSNGGQISVKIKQTPSAKPGYATYTFLIKDTGIGMSREFQKHLFETFSQERTSTNSKQLGTGLGMAIAKSYVDMMGGTISVESEVGRGTEFAVKLEFRLQEDVKPDSRLEQLHGYRALVVDDDFQSCDSIVHLLQDIGMRADFTTTAKEALFRTKMAYGDGDSYFAYIIDWIMPDMNGIELVRQIRKIIGDEVPIIILTAYYWGDIEEEAREAGVTAFCTKPLFASDLTNIFLQHEAAPEAAETHEHGRILLVEDNDLNREIAKFMLEEVGYEVDIACDGQDAVDAMEKAADGFYNYVLMDVQMPIMDGIEATRRIRASERRYLQTVPIIALTANAFNEDVARCIDSGMNAHLAKPFKIGDILTMLQAFSDRS